MTHITPSLTPNTPRLVTPQSDSFQWRKVDEVKLIFVLKRLPVWRENYLLFVSFFAWEGVLPAGIEGRDSLCEQIHVSNNPPPQETPLSWSTASFLGPAPPKHHLLPVSSDSSRSSPPCPASPLCPLWNHPITPASSHSLLCCLWTPPSQWGTIILARQGKCSFQPRAHLCWAERILLHCFS